MDYDNKARKLEYLSGGNTVSEESSERTLRLVKQNRPYPIADINLAPKSSETRIWPYLLFLVCASVIGYAQKARYDETVVVDQSKTLEQKLK